MRRAGENGTGESENLDARTRGCWTINIFKGNVLHTLICVHARVSETATYEVEQLSTVLKIPRNNDSELRPGENTTTGV